MYDFLGKGFLSGFQIIKFGSEKNLRNILEFDLKNHFTPNDYVVGLFCDEPSSRTRFSTESILRKLGANVILINSLEDTSYAKGESLKESLNVWNHYFDLIAIRSKKEFLPFKFNKYSSIPVINLGDGSNEHPTQGLATLAHVYQHFNRIHKLAICIWGDILKSRTAHSVLIMFSLLGAVVYLYPIPKGYIPGKLIKLIKSYNSNVKINIINHLDRIDQKIDMFYINRLQEERWKLKQQYENFKLEYCDLLNNDGIILHPLPHNKEIGEEIINHRNSRILEHISITKKVRGWIFFKYKEAYEMNLSIHDNRNFFNHIYSGTDESLSY